MSLEINLEDFPNLLSVFEEIERRELRRSFPSVDPELENLLNRERKPRAFTTLEGKPEGPNTGRELSKQDGRQRTSSAKKIPTALGGKAAEGKLHKSNRGTETSGKHKRLSRCASVPVRHTLDVSQSRFRIHSEPLYLPVDRDTLLTDRRFTNAARNLSDEELAELYEDILKPLDFYAMLHERRKQS